MNRRILDSVQNQCRKRADPAIAAHSRRYFKTAPGEYGYGDEFLGIRTPDLENIARCFKNLPLAILSALLQSPYHEERSVALRIWVRQYETGSEKQRETMYLAYLAHTRWINNWDLVDVSAHKIVGAHLLTRDCSVLYSLAKSPSLWERRIAIIATLRFIQHDRFTETLELADLLLRDPEDLVQKAVGWMLRETGKRDPAVLLKFLKSRYPRMPRTMLRYAIEKLDTSLRRAFLCGTA